MYHFFNIFNIYIYIDRKIVKNLKILIKFIYTNLKTDLIFYKIY